eukprot:gene34607-1006_t
MDFPPLDGREPDAEIEVEIPDYDARRAAAAADPTASEKCAGLGTDAVQQMMLMSYLSVLLERYQAGYSTKKTPIPKDAMAFF